MVFHNDNYQCVVLVAIFYTSNRNLENIFMGHTDFYSMIHRNQLASYADFGLGFMVKNNYYVDPWSNLLSKHSIISSSVYIEYGPLSQMAYFLPTQSHGASWMAQPHLHGLTVRETNAFNQIYYTKNNNNLKYIILWCMKILWLIDNMNTCGAS